MRQVSISQASLTGIIVEGDAEELVLRAKELGTALSDSLKTSQIRNIYGSVRQLQMSWPAEPKDPDRVSPDEELRIREASAKAHRRMLLLIPRLRYQAARIQEVKPLADVLEPAIRLVEKDRKRFQHFAEFFEAVLAYHRAAGGKS